MKPVEGFCYMRFTELKFTFRMFSYLCPFSLANLCHQMILDCCLYRMEHVWPNFGIEDTSFDIGLFPSKVCKTNLTSCPVFSLYTEALPVHRWHWRSWHCRSHAAFIMFYIGCNDVEGVLVLMVMVILKIIPNMIKGVRYLQNVFVHLSVWLPCEADK